MNHILALTDFSTSATYATDVALKMANAYHTQLSIYHNIDHDEWFSFDLNPGGQVKVGGSLGLVNTQSIKALEEAARSLKVKTQFLVSSGDLDKEVENISKSLDIDLIVMGSRGKGGLRTDIWGSNAQRVAKEVEKPILVLHKPLENFDFQSIIFASSFEASDLEAFKHFLSLMQVKAPSTIHLLSVDTYSFFSQPGVMMNEAMAKFSEAAGPILVKSHFYPDYSVDAGIKHFVEETKADLLVMSNRHHKPFKRLFQGSSALRVLNETDVPTLLIDF